MDEDQMLKCLICFVLGYLLARMMRGDGMLVGEYSELDIQNDDNNTCMDNKQICCGYTGTRGGNCKNLIPVDNCSKVEEYCDESFSKTTNRPCMLNNNNNS